MVPRDRDHIAFVPQAGATHGLMEETPRVNTGVSFLLMVPSLPREAVS